MDLLIDRSRSRRWPALVTSAAAAALAVAAASCLFVGGERVRTFPHDVHVDSMKLACTFCHVTVRTTEVPSMPPPELCAPCHDELDRGVPPEHRIAALFSAGGRYRRLAPKPLPADVRFSHRDHAADATIDCADCHGNTIGVDHIRSEPIDWKTDCMECHAQRGMDTGVCSTCHRAVNRDAPPRSHDRAWDVRHGEVVRSGDRSSLHRCELCHEQTNSCQACHQNNPPRSHNNYFRLRGHGLLASIDRSGCYTCHRTDTCQQCHSETRPLSHRGGFGSPLQRHCNGCHFPASDAGCAVCHRGTPSHLQATPMPPSHSPAMNCRMCHGNGQRLPHPDGGHQCTICHK